MATISFDTYFLLGTTTPVFNFRDTSNYAGQGIGLADVTGIFRITSPSGVVIYNNIDITNGGCDIDVVANLNSQQTIVLPLVSGGLVEPGVYTVLYSVWNSNLNDWSYVTNTYTFSYIAPEVCIEQDVDCLSPLFTSTDVTDYTVDGIVPTKTITHTLYYPNGSAGQGSPSINAALVLTASTFYQGTQTTTISTALSYVYPDGAIVTDVVTGSEEILVDCRDVCGIYCCIRSIEQQMIEYKCSDRVKYAEYSLLFSKILGYVSLALLAIRCGKSDDVNGFLSELRTLSRCTSDCGCSGETPSQVTGLGGLVNQIVVNGGNANITVTPVTVGNTTTYTVTLSTTFSALVSSLYNTVVVAGNNVTVSGPVIAGIVHTYTVNGLKATVGSADGSITVTPGAVVAGVQNYDLSVSLEAERISTDYNTPFALTVANGITVTGCSGTAAVAGTYLIICEADLPLITNGVMSSVEYRLHKTGAVAINDDRVAFVTDVAVVAGDSVITMKMFCTAIAVLTAGQVVTLNVDSNYVGTVGGRSITMVKIA